MSVEININDYSLQTRKQILSDLTICSNVNKYSETQSSFKLFEISKTNKNGVLVPFSYYYQFLKTSQRLEGNPEGFLKNKSTICGEPERFLKNESINTNKYATTNLKFTGQLNEVQSEILYETMQTLKTTGSILISLYTGCGKTIFSIYLSIILKLKTLIFVHRVNIIDQWVSSIKKVCPTAKIQLLDSKCELDSTADFYLINVDVLKNKTTQDFLHIGTVISDESHCICTENRSSNLFLFNCKYLIGLTATPERSDGLDKILTVFFGPYWIIKKMQRSFNVYIYKTNYKPISISQKNGKLNWNAMIKNMCENIDRNNIIINLCNYFINRNILVLCKRKTQTQYLFNTYKNKLINYNTQKNNFCNIDCEIYIESQKKFNENCRILFSTYSKSGIGFDFSKLDMLIIASDVDEGIIQYLGRVFRKTNTLPIIIDFNECVYKHHPFNKHLNNRINVYESSGGVVKDFMLNFSDFKKHLW
jgi:superfamily II DNA or RNA helicase